MKIHVPHRVEHGGQIRWHQDTGKKDLLDFSANLNPFPPEFDWKPDLSSISSYPDDRYHVLKSTIARQFHRKPEEICVGNGSVEIIRTFCQSCIRPGDRVRIDPPTFGEYAFSSQIAGGICIEGESDADVRFICNPNNPTGELLEKKSIQKIVADAEKHGQLVFVDEAFIELADPFQSVIDVCSENLFVLRSLTKAYAVPGLRFGYGIGNPDLIETIERIRPPWTVNAFAEDYAKSALLHYGELERSRIRIMAEREWLYSRLNDLHIDFTPSFTNFILLNVHRDASTLAGQMFTHNILVRDCSSFGLPHSIRIAIRTRAENEALVEALAACLR